MLSNDEQRQYRVLGGRQPDGVRSECFCTVSPIVDPWRGHRQIVRDPPMDNSIALRVPIFLGISSLPRYCALPSDDQWEGLDNVQVQDSFHK